MVVHGIRPPSFEVGIIQMCFSGCEKMDVLGGLLHNDIRPISASSLTVRCSVSFDRSKEEIAPFWYYLNKVSMEGRV
jgi:hypothetical protein